MPRDRQDPGDRTDPAAGTGRRVVVAGAGAAGLMAALAAAERGARVVVFERMDAPGIKLLATGGGRCNLTNMAAPDDFMACFGRSGRFMQPALRALGREGLLDLLARLGVETSCADGFHVFPRSERARDVRDALWQACTRAGVSFLYRRRVTRLTVEDGAVRGVEAGGTVEPADRVVLACGGRSWGSLGSDGSGFALAQAVGHRIVEPVPALVPLATAESWPGRCAGITLPDAEVRLAAGKARAAPRRGALLFTHRGLSGPAVLDLSGAVASELASGRAVALRIDLAPERSDEDLRRQLAAWRREQGGRPLAAALSGLLPRGLVECLLAARGVPPDRACGQATRAEQEAVVSAVKDVRLAIAATEGFERSMVTRGGVDLGEVLPETLESRRIGGLHFAGEILNLDGPCGGYNLQWAFASGWLAGTAAAETGEAPGAPRG